MSTFTRRRFLAGVTAAGASTLAGRIALAEARAAVRGADQVALGDTGLKTSLLGLGTGTRGGREQRELGQEDFTRLFRYALDRGVRYIDTADSYRIHAMVGAALRGVPRDDYFLLTKTGARDAAAARSDIDRFRRELGVERFDVMLMHCMTTGDYPNRMQGVMDVLSEAKEKGIIGSVGVSCHGWDPLCASADCDWNDVHLVRINPFGSHMDGEPADVAEQIAKMHRQGRGVLGMKIFGEGNCDTREKRLESLRYVLGLGTVHAFTIGFGSRQQIDETLALIEEASA